MEADFLLANKVSRGGIKGEAFNFGYELEKTVKDVVQDILSIMGKHHLVPTVLGTATHEIERQVVSCEKARTVLDWKPSIGYLEGLKRAVSWYSNFLSGK